MARWTPDPTLYDSPRHAAAAPRERLAYVALRNAAGNGGRDAIGVVDTDPDSPDYARVVARTDLPQGDNELHRFGWNVCSSQLGASAPAAGAARRYLVVPGMHSSRIHVLDTGPDPRAPTLVKVLEGEEVMASTGYATPHAVRCGPDGIYCSALGAPDGNGPGGIFLLDHDTFEPKGRWDHDRGPQHLAGDCFWHLGHDTMVTSEWGTPNMVRNGLDLELLLAGKYGNALHVWDLSTRIHRQKLELGPEQQMVLEVCPAHNPARAYGFAGVVISRSDLSASVFLWYLHRTGGRARGEWKVRRVITIPAEPAHPAELPPLLRGLGAVPPLVTNVNLSVDDRFLYVSCWGTGELRQYDVSDPFSPRLAGSVRIGGIVRRAGHPAHPGEPLNGGPQMVEVSRDGRRIYLTNALHSRWDAQFHPDGLRGWLAKLDTAPNGGLAFDPDFLIRFEDGLRPHQVRLEGGDASSDSFCSS